MIHRAHRITCCCSLLLRGGNDHVSVRRRQTGAEEMLLLIGLTYLAEYAACLSISWPVWEFESCFGCLQLYRGKRVHTASESWDTSAPINADGQTDAPAHTYTHWCSANKLNQHSIYFSFRKTLSFLLSPDFLFARGGGAELSDWDWSWAAVLNLCPEGSSVQTCSHPSPLTPIMATLAVTLQHKPHNRWMRRVPTVCTCTVFNKQKADEDQFWLNWKIHLIHLHSFVENTLDACSQSKCKLQQSQWT